MSSKNVIVIGGGLAGLAAGVALAESGWQVKLFELRPFLGGRATSFVLPSGEHVDNCQHVTLGCCTNLDDFYRRVGSAGKVKFFDRLFFLDPQGRSGAMQAGILPAPFHMMGSFATFAPLSLGDKLSIARAMMRILFTAGKPKEADTPAGISMLDWLKNQKQTPRAIERFWRVVLVSALDEELDRTDARFGIDVFWKAFLSNRTGYRMGVPAVPLAELYDGCRIAIEKKGGEVALRAPVRGVRMENGAIAAVQFDNGREESADAYVFALPHTALASLLPPEIQSANPALSSLEKIKVSPITGVHFWFDREITREPFITLLDTNVQWVFNKTALYSTAAAVVIPSAARDLLLHPAEQTADSSGQLRPRNDKQSEIAARSSGQYLQLVISASYDLLKKSREEIIDLCLKEIRQALPAAREAQLVKATVIKEASATFSPEPGVDRFRPAQSTNTPGLFLAGDWTATGWPATMEGAVRSGYLAAEAVLRSAGSPAQFLQPDLPATGLSRFFA
ncbi:MAG TPA: hydroxysqualene dehydroxylase HpnE [Candidatus Acidoferrum sp.]|nr:hydroxysqualene dehydroxylase HpnE [Candidatus Acidoferrum sp.]